MLDVFSPNMRGLLVQVGFFFQFVFCRGLLGFCGIVIKNRGWKEGEK